MKTNKYNLLLFFFTITINLSSCISGKPITSFESSVELNVYINNDVEKIYPGEAVSLLFVMENNSNEIIEITNFAMQGTQFVFNSPNAISLISPSGNNLFQGFFSEHLPTEWETIKINPGYNSSFLIYPHQFLALTEAGKYDFFVALKDKEGNFYQSSTKQFEILPIPTECPLQDIKLIANANKTKIKYSERLDLEITTTIQNNSDQLLAFYEFIAPHYLLNPIYIFQWQDSNNHFLVPNALQDSSNNHIFPIYENLAVHLEAKKSHKMVISGYSITDYALLKTPGNYILKIIYIFLPIDSQSKQTLNIPNNTCLGVIESNPVQIEILPEE